MNKQLDYSKYFSSPELLANAVLEQYKNEIGDIKYPINPFKILKSLDVKLVIKNFKKLEGLYIPATSEEDIDVVAVNYNDFIKKSQYFFYKILKLYYFFY